MCGICGCGEATVHSHLHENNTDVIVMEKNIMAENNSYAQLNRDYFSKNKILAINLVSSPGSGKTTLLENTLYLLANEFTLAVIEGDQQTDCDAERIRATGVPVVQINTGNVCHLDAHRIGHAVQDLAVQPESLLFIENVGNLVCPALFDLGEAHKVVLLSVTEGDDKPLKYPQMFAKSSLMIINKMDLLPYVDFNVDRCVEYAKRINPTIEVIQISANKAQGQETWLVWLQNAYKSQ